MDNKIMKKDTKVLWIIGIITIIAILYNSNFNLELFAIQSPDKSFTTSLSYNPNLKSGDCWKGDKTILSVVQSGKNYKIVYIMGCNCTVISETKNADINIFVIPSDGQTYSETSTFSKKLVSYIKSYTPFNQYKYNVYYSKDLNSCNQYKNNGPVEINYYLTKDDDTCQMISTDFFKRNIVCSQTGSAATLHELGHAIGHLDDLYTPKYDGLYKNLMSDPFRYRRLDQWQIGNFKSSVALMKYVYTNKYNIVCMENDIKTEQTYLFYNSYCKKDLCQKTGGLWKASLVYNTQGSFIFTNLCYCSGQADPNLRPDEKGIKLFDGSKGCINHTEFKITGEPYSNY